MTKAAYAAFLISISHLSTLFSQPQINKAAMESGPKRYEIWEN